MNQTSKFNMGIRWGLLTGLTYVVLLYIRYHFAASNPIFIGLFAIISYFLILLLYLFTGMAKKKQLGGYGEMREIFQPIFIAILIAELFFVLFNLYYFKFVDPAFWDKFKAASLVLMEKAGMSQSQIDEKMKSFKDVDQQTRPMGLLKGYGTSVVVDSIFGLIFAAILKKKKPMFTTEESKK